MHQCAYCMQQKPYHRKKSLRKPAWGSEHVLPEAICGFRGELTIWDYVCAACNESFGQNHDLWLCRASIVAIGRLRYGMKPLEELAEVDFSRMQVISKVDGKDFPAKCSWVSGPTGLEIKEEITALRLINRDGEEIYLSVGEIATRADLFDLLRNAVEQTGFTTHIDGALQLAEALERRGAIVRNLGFDGKKTVDSQVSEQYDFDWPVMRAYAKIGFNYFIKRCTLAGNQDFLRQEFNAIRAFINEGAHPGFMPVKPLHEKLNTSNGDATHLVVQQIQKHSQLPMSRICVGIFLFNAHGIEVCLTPSYTGCMVETPVAHGWHITSKQCFPLTVGLPATH